MDAIAANENVFWTGEWKKDYKTVAVGAAPAKTTASASASEARWMQVGSLLTGDDGAADLRDRLEALPAEVQDAFPRIDGSSAVAFLTDAQIDEVASWPDVEWIEPKLKPRLFNDKAALTNMMNVANAWKSLSSGGLGLTGAGQIVAVADTGCDTGVTTNLHADFAGRIVAGYGWTNGAYKSSASWADLDAHGTHVCGSILGSGAASTNLYRGMAYEAQLVMQGMWEDLGGLPNNTASMLKQAYSAGARIHSDSWGYGTNYAGAYVYDSVYSDGYMWTNQNFIMVIAAGNDGIDANSDGVIDAGSVTAPGTAKNCICVGAAENYRSSGGYAASTYGKKWSSDYPADPIKSDKISQTNTPQGIVAFSARGPTLDGRFKPDIVAPGSDVISVRSRASDDTGWGLNSANTNYIYMGGTSMATPLTSGTMALIRQWLVDRKGINEPMAALMKALLINGARDMTPGQYGTGSTQEITARPDRSQGFGHVNLYNALEPGGGNFLVFVTNKLTTSANFTTNIAVGQANAGTYRLTLVWQDYPGSSGGSKNLVNDLDLTVTSPSGTVYYPNNLSGLDHTNNVEFIEFTATETGTYAVKVNGYSVSKTSPNGGQPFALVMRGPETSTDPVPPAFSSSTSATNGVQYEDIEFDFRALLTAGYPTPTYHLTTTVSTNEYDFDTGYLYYTPQSYGTFTFKCVASNENGTATNTLTVTVTQAPPAVPANLTLSNVDASSFTASWSAAANAASYRLDVVKGTSFEASAGDPVLQEGFASSSPDGWQISVTGTYNSSPYVGSTLTGSYSLKFGNSGQYAVTPDFGSGVKLSFWAYGNNGSGSTFAISGLVGGSWTDIETVTIAQGGDTYEVSLPSGTSQIRFDFTKSVNCALDDVIVYAPSASAGEYVPGWSNATVNATSANVTGLQPSTTYAVRVRAVNGGGTSSNSAVATATTLAGVSTPAWTAFPATVVDVGTNCWLDIASYASGSPAPTVTLVSSTADSNDYEFEDGYLMFAPPAGDNYTFTFAASNSAGTSNATLTVTGNAEAPVLATIGNRSGTVGEYVQFPLSATGIPAPAFGVSSTDAEDVVVMEQTGTFYFLFTPTNTGTFHFTVTATNIAGTASESFTVTVNAAPVTVPTLTVTNVAATSAFATWTACDNVSAYTLQLASDDQFTTGGSGGTVLEETFDTTNAPSGWTISDGGTYNSSPYVSSTYARKFTKVNQYAVTPDFGSGTALQFWAYGNGGSGSIFTISGLVNSVWTFIDTVSIAQNADTYDVTLPSGTSQIGFYFTTRNNNCALDNVTVAGASGSGSLILSETVSDTTFSFTALSPETTYYARVKGTNDWSNIAQFTTTSAGDSAPAWSAFPATTVDVGTNCWLDIASYVTGTPPPTITLVSSTASTDDYEFEDGYLMFAPPASGTYTFTFRASNSIGTADATLTVTGHAEAPSLSASLGTSLSSTVGDNVEFTVTATGIPAPGSIGATCPEGAYFVFENGAFLFDSPAVGTYHFVFTAINVAGTNTLTVTVEVSAAPVTVPDLLVDDVTATTAYATWSDCTGVSAYTLQLASDEQFTTGGSGGGGETLKETFTNASFTTTSSSYTDQTISGGDLGTWTATSCRGDSSAPIIRYAGTLTSPTIASGVASVEFDYDWPYSESGSCDIELYVGGTSQGTATVTGGTSGTATYTLSSPVAGPTTIELRNNASSNKRMRVTEIRIATPSSGSSGTGSLIDTFTVATNEYTFTGLSPETTYYARVKGNSDWSNVTNFTTLAAGTAPSWSTLPTPSLVAGAYYSLPLSDYVGGDPAPVILLNSSTASSADYEYEDGLLEYQPKATGTFTFVFTASNAYGTADATLTVTVTGSAPVWQTLPAQTIAVAEDCELYLTSYVSGTPAPAISLTTGDDIAGFDPDDDNYFYFTTSTAGTYTFVFTASNVLGTATASLTVTVTGGELPPFEQWLADHKSSGHAAGDEADNGHTYWDNYIADVDPTNAFLSVAFASSTNGNLDIGPVSTNRRYELWYYTDMTTYPTNPIINDLGRGATNPFTFPTNATGFGRIRVTIPTSSP